MRLLRRNARTIHLSYLVDTVEIVNAEGKGTGEYRNVYSDPVSILANVGTPGGKTGVSGDITHENFGLLSRYERVIALYDKSLPITETTLVWVDKTPREGSHDYEVLRIMPNLNSLLVAVKAVSVDG